MNNRIFTIVLTLVLVLGLLLPAGMLPTSAAEGDLVITPVTTVPTETNLLQGLTPTSGDKNATGGTVATNSDNAILTDGAFTNAEDRDNTCWVSNWTAKKLCWDLGRTAEITQFLMGSDSDEYVYNKSLNIYVSDDKATLFDEKNKMIAATGITRKNNLFSIEGTTFTGRYVGFENPDITDQAPFWGSVRFGELGVYGSYTGEAPTVITPATTMPTETNLLQGLTPTSGDSNAGNHQFQDFDILYDGQFATSDTATRWMVGWQGRKLCWDLGKTTEITQFLMGSEYESAQWNKSLNIYVSNDKATLFDEENKVIEATGITGQNNLFSKQGVTFIGRYVGFQNPDVFDDDTTFWGSLRLGELGVYGTPLATPTAELTPQLRDPEGGDTYDLRFRYSMPGTSGVKYLHGNPQTANDYTRDITNAMVEVNGKQYTLVEFGAIVSIKSGETMTLDALNDYTKDVPAKRLYDIADGTVTYTAVVTGIPAANKETPIYSRSYMTLSDGTTTFTLYGSIANYSVSAIWPEA